MLEGAYITPGNRHRYIIVIDHGLIYSEKGAHNIFSFHRKALQKTMIGILSFLSAIDMREL